ncbi:MAG: hypothetical protein HZB25_08470 [Candidatus Eisenbacteria bacterium]|nr:hypothetical protein [Candidatus Eisenbacteria bacterium]
MSSPKRLSSIPEDVPAWASLLPGYRGYKERELLREDDRAVRDHASAGMRKSADVLRRLSAEHLRHGPDELLKATDWLSVELRTLADATALAPGGYGSLFDRKQVKQEELGQLLALDLDLLRGLLEVEARVSGLEDSVAEPGRFMLVLQALRPRVDSLRSTLERRADLLR